MRRIVGSVGVLLLLGLTTTLAGAWGARSSEHRAIVAGAERRAELSSTVLQAEIQRYEDTTSAVAAALSAQLDVDREAFKTVANAVTFARLKGASTVEFVVPATAEEVPQVQAYWRRRGAASLTLTGPGPEHLFVIYERSLDGATRVAGRDLSPSATAVQALTLAKRTGRVTVSNPDRTTGNQQLSAGGQGGLFLFVAGVDNPVTGMIRGWALIGVRAGDLLRGTLDATSQDTVNATLTANGSDGHPVPVASRVSGRASDPDLLRREYISSAQAQWVLQVHTTDEAARQDAGSGYLATVVLAGGGTVSGLLASVLYLLMTSRYRAFSAVESATADLRAAERDATRQAGLLSAVLDSISDGVSVVDESGTFLVHNPAARAIFGLDDPSENADWRDRFTVLRPDGATPFPPEEWPLTRALNGEVTDHVEMVVRHAGKPLGTPVSVSGRPLDPRAGTTGAVGVFHDISARIDAAREVKAADERFRFAFDHAHVGMTISDLSEDSCGHGRLLRVNDAFCLMVGYPVARLLEGSFLDLIHPEDRADYGTTLSEIVRAGDTGLTIEMRFLHADGHVVWSLINSTIVRGPQGAAQYAITQVEDITQRRADNERLAALALQDPLTGLGNRVQLDDRLNQAAARSARSGLLLAVLFCDLDGFKRVNDTHGHAAGDELLREVARRFRETVRPVDTVTRVGGDEFVVLCEELTGAEAAEEIAMRIRAALSTSMELTSGASVTVGCSIGIAFGAGPDIDVDHLLQHADAEMYTAKRAARFGAATAATRVGRHEI